jgi:hypothetical protein
LHRASWSQFHFTGSSWQNNVPSLHMNLDLGRSKLDWEYFMNDRVKPVPNKTNPGRFMYLLFI